MQKLCSSSYKWFSVSTNRITNDTRLLQFNHFLWNGMNYSLKMESFCSLVVVLGLGTGKSASIRLATLTFIQIFLYPGS